MLTTELIEFLTALAQNNNRDWFNAHKSEFITHQATAKSFFAEVENRLQATDVIEAHKIYRIYRDVRFSKDSTPFKSRFAGSFIRATALRRGGYYLSIEPGNTVVGGGFYNPNKEDLKRIRKEFEQDDTEIRTILTDKQFMTFFGGLNGSEVKSAPRGFDPKHPAIDLIRKKQFYAMRSFTDMQVLQPDFIDQVVETYKTLHPYFDYMSAVLTTNLDGEEIMQDL